jgi:hypothetical protein
VSEYIVVIRTFANEPDAEAARETLASAGIRALILRESRPGATPPPGRARPVRLAVGEDDAKEAKALLDAPRSPELPGT